MNIEKQTVNLELSKKLKELGVKQESLFIYINPTSSGYETRFIAHSFLENDFFIKNECYSAFTASELLEILPNEITERFDYGLRIEKYEYSFLVDYITEILDGNFECPISFHPCRESNLCNALAELLIHLIERGTIKP